MKLYDDLLSNGYYTTRLWIGTPPQEFALIVDTGSIVTYVPCSNCKQCGKHQVSEILTENSSIVKGVLLADGTWVESSAILSNATPYRTYVELVPTNVLPEKFVYAIKNSDYSSVSILCRLSPSFSRSREDKSLQKPNSFFLLVCSLSLSILIWKSVYIHDIEMFA